MIIGNDRSGNADLRQRRDRASCSARLQIHGAHAAICLAAFVPASRRYCLVETRKPYANGRFQNSRRHYLHRLAETQQTPGRRYYHRDTWQSRPESGTSCHGSGPHAEDLFMVPPFHRELVRGVATYALELFTEVATLDTVYVPIDQPGAAAGDRH